LKQESRNLTRLTVIAGVAGLVLQGVGVLLGLVDPGRDLHMDEALYVSWARRMADFNDWFLRYPGYRMDKPPFFLLSLALSLKAFGHNLVAMHLPNLVFGAAACAFTFRLGFHAGGAAAGWLALALLGSSWFWQFYSFSVFTDVALTAATVGAVCAAVEGRWALAGSACALAAGFKQFGLFTAVFVPALMLVNPPGPSGAAFSRFARGFAPVALSVLAWEAFNRNPLLPWMVTRQVTLGFDPSSIPSRFADWAGLFVGIWIPAF